MTKPESAAQAYSRHVRLSVAEWANSTRTAPAFRPLIVRPHPQQERMDAYRVIPSYVPEGWA